MTTLTQGSTGDAVTTLQTKLAKLGYEIKVDGAYGPKTRDTVLEFQLDYSDVDDDGIAGPQTLAKIDAVLRAAAQPSVEEHVQCNDETWAAFEKLVSLVTKTPVRYGPGRGLWRDGKFIITHGPGNLGLKSWKNIHGKSYPSFHCSSWTNFFLGWLLRRNQYYTHAGNIPSLFDLLTQDNSVHQNPGAGPYRGYGDVCFSITPDGTGAKRHGVANVMDMRELYERRKELPSFIVCGQSTKKGMKWKWWHHTVLFATRGGNLYRIAADGYRHAEHGYSAYPMRWVEIMSNNVTSYQNVVYRAFGVTPNADGSYGFTTEPIADVVLEE